jgi:alpha-L-rhamnosidase
MMSRSHYQPVFVYAVFFAAFSTVASHGDDAVTTPSTTAAPGKEYVISDYGAVGDGTTLNTAAIQKAIDQLAAGGGGTVVVPKGSFLTGAIFLKPGVNLRLEKDAVLQGSTNIADYPEMNTRIEGHFQVWIPALVNADSVDHLRITGEGTIQGGGKPYWDAFWAARAANKETANLDVKRPRNMFIRDSKDVQISGISLRQSGFWNMHLFRCQNVLVDKVDIQTPEGAKAPSTDGIDVDSCQNVTIRGCYISVDDDDIAIKGNKGTSALDDTTIPPDQHILITGCTFGHGNAALTLGSEATSVTDVVIENCKLTGTESNSVMKLKLRPDTEQHYENITARNITVDNPAAQLIGIDPWTQYFDLQGKPAPSQLVNNITMSDITGTLKGFGRIDGPEKSTVQNITFKNINITVKSPDVVTKNVKNLKFDNVMINGTAYTGDAQTAGN